MEELKLILKQYLDDSIAKLKQSYVSRGLRASGNWGNSLDQEITSTEFNINAKIIGPKYTGALEYGRKPTKNPGTVPLSTIIKKWVEDKGIVARDGISKESLIFLITRKIHREGIKVPNVYNDGLLVKSVITDESLKELSKKLNKVLIVRIKNEITSTVV